MRTLPLACSPGGVRMPGSRNPEPFEAGAGSTVSSAAPTRTLAPGSACSAVTVPANGTGTSTAAFAVSTSSTTWSTSTWSPTPTRQATTDASSRPSPRSGSRKSGTPHLGDVVPLQSGDRVEDPVDARQVVLLELGRRIRDVEPGDAQD